jgi:hypothetical protein
MLVVKYFYILSYLMLEGLYDWLFIVTTCDKRCCIRG